MKFVLATFAALAVIGLGQTHKLPDFGKGPLHDDIQDALDLIPMDEIVEVSIDYLSEDPEVQAAAEFLTTTSTIKDMTIEFQAIPEVINFFNYLQKEGVNIYDIMNKINNALKIKELVPPVSYVYSTSTKRTGGLAGLFKDVKKLFHYDYFITFYVQKMKTSPAFVGFVNQLKSQNFQQIVNKVYQIKPFQIILNGLKSSGVNVKIVGDIMFVVLGISIPDPPVTLYTDRKLADELQDFLDLIPVKQFTKIFGMYMIADKQVQKALLYLRMPEFHDMVRAVESLNEYQTLVIYLHNAGLNIFEGIQQFHKFIGMEDYIPPNIETILESEVGVQEIGGGIRALIDDLLAILPLDKIEALYNEKMQTSKVFTDFIKTISSPDMQKIVDSLFTHEIFVEMMTKAKEVGLDLEAVMELLNTIFGLKFPAA